MDMFVALDLDGSGQITREEIADVPLSVLPPTVLKNVSVTSMEDMFELLDVDAGPILGQYDEISYLNTRYQGYTRCIQCEDINGVNLYK